MNYTLRICPVCGKEFRCYGYDDWAYYRRVIKDGKYVKELLCSYHCMPKTGLINDNKYDDNKVKNNNKKQQEKNHAKYYETRSAYRKEHRAEINARQNARYNAGTPESEAARLERNRKQCEWKKQRAIEKWEGGEDK